VRTSGAALAPTHHGSSRALTASPALAPTPSGLPPPRTASPAHALYFATYEAAKRLLGGNREGHHPLAAASAGAAATLVCDAAMTPVDVIKQRLQARGREGWACGRWRWRGRP
jgi:hypothetical protein